MSIYKVRTVNNPMNIDISVPGSKSMTNRALLLAALADGESTLYGCGLSDDSIVFLEALSALGFDVKYNNDSYKIDNPIVVQGCGGKIPNKNTRVYVGSAGTAARFLTAMMGLSDGAYEVISSEQMKARPMRDLIEALEMLGAVFEFAEDEYRFPFTVFGKNSSRALNYNNNHLPDNITKKQPKEIKLNIDKSSQFLSALLLCAPMASEGFSIRLTGTRQAKSYVKISEKMMHEFGYTEDIESDTDDDKNNNLYTVSPNTHYTSREYHIEPDVSAACYYYAMVALNGGKVRVKGVNNNNSQGDMKFLKLLERMGCRTDISDDGSEDIVLYKDNNTSLHGTDVDMSDFSDQTMTLAAIAPFADGITTISGVAHIRGQESDRLGAISTELGKLGVRCEEFDDGIRIYPIDSSITDEVLINTYNDHRIAMSFAVTGTKLPGVVIDNPECCNKTFRGYFDILDELTTES